MKETDFMSATLKEKYLRVRQSSTERDCVEMLVKGKPISPHAHLQATARFPGSNFNSISQI